MSQNSDENSVVRRRKTPETRKRYPIVYQLIVLLRSRKEMRVICTNSSVAIRVAILCDMAADGCLEADSAGAIRVRQQPSREIEAEFAYKISQCSCHPRELLRTLNGESSKELGVAQLRRKLYKEMERRGIIRTNRSVLYNKIVIVNHELWSSVYSTVTEECRSGSLSIETKVLLVTLDYSNRMESLLLQCNESDAGSILRQLKNLKNKIESRMFPEEDRLVYEILACLIK